MIGVEDDTTGEAVVAYVRAPGADPATMGEAVRAHCERRLARFKQPSRIEVVDELPLTGTGKVQKGRLRAVERRRARACSNELAVRPHMTPRVTLYSRPGCHLCDDARAVIVRVCADLGEEYVEVSIDDDPEPRSASPRRSR